MKLRSALAIFGGWRPREMRISADATYVAQGAEKLRAGLPTGSNSAVWQAA